MRNMLLILWIIATGLSYANAKSIAVYDWNNGKICENPVYKCSDKSIQDNQNEDDTLTSCEKKWMCQTTKKQIFPGGLSENDYNFYLSIKKGLKEKYQNHVNKMLFGYLNKLDNYSGSQKEKINEKVVQKLEEKMGNFLLQFPQDIALPEKDNNKFLMLELLKFEIQQLDFKSNNIIGWNNALKIAKSEKLQSMSQSHDLTVKFITKKGNTFLTKEAKIDDYIQLKKACGSQCKNMPILSE